MQRFIDRSLPNRLKERLAKGLPGWKAQFKMVPITHHHYEDVTDDHVLAGVLALLFPKNDTWHITYIERTSLHPNDKHAGQISFPGGKFETTDDTLEACALREANEEVGIVKNKVTILGPLSPLFVYVSNFLVHPFLGFTDETPNFIAEESEVKKVLQVPLEYLIDEKNKGLKDLQVRGNVLKNVPYYDLYGHTLWGATAMITSELIELIKE